MEDTEPPQQHASPQSQQPQASAFQAHLWQPSDAALLQPSNLNMPKVMRAWERKPLAPFSRQRLRVGKVWKRPVAATAPSRADPAGERLVKRRKARTSSGDGGMKPVKKLCMDSGFGMGARVLQWEGCESPARKIVTRRSNVGEDEMVALPDEEEQEEGDVTVEVLDEDGTVLDVDPAEEGSWEDDEVFDDTMMHLADVVEPSETGSTSEAVDDDAQDSAEQVEESSPEPVQPTAESQQSSSSSMQLPQRLELPDGFVSPVKKSEGPVRRRARQSFGSRRRTLPVQFAPAILPTGTASADSLAEDITQSDSQREAEELDVDISEGVSEKPVELPSTDKPTEDAADQEWEDVEEETAEEDVSQPEENAMEALPTDREASPQQDYFSNDAQANTSPTKAMFKFTGISNKLPSSPVPTIEGSHPRLPLRRSPRRKSSSPLKQSAILPSNDKSHLVAFTPVKNGPALYPPEHLESAQEAPFSSTEDTEMDPGSPIQRASSAPPEEAQMSPRRPQKPRVSDDTALLQAFLNRAAESRGSRRVSATKQESITNRRDSDVVRQALSSPTKTDVLGDLDPNSPSPRKPSAPPQDQSDVFDEVIAEAAKKAQAEQEDPNEDSSAGARTRRSGRAAKKGQPSTPAAAPNKIAIRGNTENVVLKRSEAQETALLTRNNTRKNKGAAVLPPLRLTKMTLQLGGAEPEEGAEEASDEKREGVKGVRWAETLVEFYQGGEASEVSVTSSDEANVAPEPTEPAAPPPSETPSKPKMRKLKAPNRTAAAPGKVPEPPAVATPAPGPAPTGPAAATKRRSRIATPAKGLSNNSSLLPTDAEPQHTKKSTTTAAAPKASKLPTPGQGKENNTASTLTSSPPKKKPGAILPPSSKSASFAPKLDFGAPKLEPAAGGDDVPGLLSPAKKGGTRRVAPAARSEGEGVRRMDEAPGLSSPAKKRTRRAL